MHQMTLSFQTNGRRLIHITADINQVIQQYQVPQGLCHLFILHTSASLIISENADPDVLNDLEKFMQRLVPDGDSLFSHIDEGKDDMPSHIRSILTQTSLMIPIQHHRALLGRWQGIYLWEHRLQRHERKVVVSLLE